MSWFDDIAQRLQAEPQQALRPLRVLDGLSSYMLFKNQGGVFELVERVGYVDPEFVYSFLEKEPQLWAPALRFGSVCLGSQLGSRPGLTVWVCVDHAKSPDHLLIVEANDASPDVGLVCRSFLLLDIAASQVGQGRNEGASVDLPAWLLPVASDLARRSSPVLIVSEPGSGKEELVVSLLNRRFGAASRGVFFHPGRLSQAVQLRELFGDSAGARLGGTGVGVPVLRRPGNAIVIQEVADLAPVVQLRLLALLSDDSSPRFWIMETSRNIPAMVQADQFLSGLYKILKAGEVILPPLRACKQHIPDEANRLITIFRQRYKREVRLESDAIEAMVKYEWPGNWQEMKNTLESAFLMCSGLALRAEDLRLGRWASSVETDDLNLRKRSEELEKSLLLRAYALHGGNQVQMAKALGISRGSLQYKMEKLRLS